MKFNVAVVAILAACLAGAPLIVAAQDTGTGTSTTAPTKGKGKKGKKGKKGTGGTSSGGQGQKKDPYLQQVAGRSHQLPSGGQRQAIAVARSVYAKAKVLLLDEPTAAMGVRESTIILDLIRRLKEKGEISIIIVAHNYTHIFDVCDRVSLLQNGEIAFSSLTKNTSVEELMKLVLHELRRPRERPSRS